MLGTLEEKKRLQGRSNGFLLICIVLMFFRLFVPSVSVASDVILFIAIPSWFLCCANLAASRGYHMFVGAVLGFIPIFGLIILCLIPDRFTLPPDRSLHNPWTIYPRG